MFSGSLKEGVATKYEYDILGCRVKDEMPQEKKDGSVSYQTTVMEYDDAGNITAKEEQVDSDRTARTEYTYDKRGNVLKNTYDYQNRLREKVAYEKEIKNKSSYCFIIIGINNDYIICFIYKRTKNFKIFKTS